MNQSQQLIQDLSEASRTDVPDRFKIKPTDRGGASSGGFPDKKTVFSVLKATLGKNIKSKSSYDPKTGVVVFDASVTNLDRLVTAFDHHGFALRRMSQDQQQAGSIKMQFRKR